MAIYSDFGETYVPKKQTLHNSSSHASDAQSGRGSPEGHNTPPITDGPPDHKDSPYEKRKHPSTDAPLVSAVPAFGNRAITDSTPKRRKRLSFSTLPVPTIPAPDKNTSIGSALKRQKRLYPDALPAVHVPDSILKRRKCFNPNELALSTMIDGLFDDKDSPKHAPPVLATDNGTSHNNPFKNPLFKGFRLVVKVTPDKVSQRGEPMVGRFIHRGRLCHREKWISEKKIGNGAFGSVYLQRKKGTEDVRAVKRLTKDNWKELERELENLILVVDRPDLFVHFHGWYEDHNFVFYVMEYLKYGDLGKYMERNPEHVLKDAREISRQILEGLEILHERQIGHRDLKPQNVLIASLSPIRIKLADFGISKCEVDSVMKTTRMGTIGYIAPEVLRFKFPGSPAGRQYTNAVDMWSFGCLVHVMLTGKQPFTQDRHFDMSIFAKFCEGQTELAGTILSAHVKDPFALDFVKRLLIQDGSQRMSASEALGHKWITNGTSLANAMHDQSESLSAVDNPSSTFES